MEISMETYKNEIKKCNKRMMYYKNKEDPTTKIKLIKLLNYLEKKDPTNYLDIDLLKELIKSI